MPFDLTAAEYTTYPGSVLLSVVGDAGLTAQINRIDAGRSEPVRNFSSTGSGLEQVLDMEAPLGRGVTYNLIDAYGVILAQSNVVTCADLPGGKSLLRSVLRPVVGWMVVEPVTEAGVQWASSTTTWSVVGQDTPVIVGEVRQRHSGTITFLAKTISEADSMVALMRDGVPLLVRHSSCGQRIGRDMLMYATNVTEALYGRAGWRLIAVDYQTTAFVPGETETPPIDTGRDFAMLATEAATFGELTALYDTFGDMALGVRN